MNRTDRLLAIVLELQSRKRMRAEDLAALFETSVRTIYRDMQALSETGVPVVGSPGQGYSLMDGYFLPPLTFSGEEALTLLLGSDSVTAYLDRHYQRCAESSRSKLEAVLPAPVRREVEQLRSQLRVLQLPKDIVQLDVGHGETLVLLREAIAAERSVSFGYDKRSGDGEMDREVDPYGLAFAGGRWLLVAFCRLRGAMRHFRVDRMSGVRFSGQTFRRPADFSMQEYAPEDNRTLEVKVLFPAEAAARVKEARGFFPSSCEDTADGLLVTLHVRQESDALRWLLGWGRLARVLEPATLAERIAEEAQAMLGVYGH
ncbi:YafY family transcriptional regulator [Paenibacillus athensensis]|uniref:HTH deoR-type domain-containing protein n=1 Tax=Paenibacillus athensensis TaxID=1967502 RepID=A0A4Y8PTR0_9BACL|nr:YafY family protein [Paenibacillus athensensis]MCD1261320.1 YafY family transcriptional regulator [Paenibacillus athensensis]